jgi:hypothetical protein
LTPNHKQPLFIGDSYPKGHGGRKKYPDGYVLLNSSMPANKTDDVSITACTIWE